MKILPLALQRGADLACSYAGCNLGQTQQSCHAIWSTWKMNRCPALLIFRSIQIAGQVSISGLNCSLHRNMQQLFVWEAGLGKERWERGKCLRVCMHVPVCGGALPKGKGGGGEGWGADYLQKEAITELHDVGFVDGSDLSSVVQEGIAEGVLRNAPRTLLRDDLQALNHIRHHLMLQPTVFSLRIFSACTQSHSW